jgi:glyoxylase-like metal-dependent hydrolase (beta-lactamase superfamily II)
VPGRLSIGADRELELYPVAGHTGDGTAFWIPWAGVLVCGDYLSPVEIPTPEASLEGYLATLARLEPFVAQAEYVVPGHGGPLERPAAQALLGEDRAYLEALRGGAAAGPALPRTRRDAEQRRLHAANLARLREGRDP